MIQERIKALIDTLEGGNLRAFAASIGVPQSTLNSVVNKPHADPRSALLTAIVLRYPGVSARWLLTGREPMFLESAYNQYNQITGGVQNLAGRDIHQHSKG